MERKNLEAGKKTAQDLAPEPTEHIPEAPIISEEEAQVIESPEHDNSDDAANQAGASGGGIVDKMTGKDDDTVPEEGSVRVHPHHDE